MPAYRHVMGQYEFVRASFTACNSKCCLDLVVCSVGVGERAAGGFFFLKKQQYSLIPLKN